MMHSHPEKVGRAERATGGSGGSSPRGSTSGVVALCPGALGHAMWTTNRRDGGRWGTWAGVAPAARRAGAQIRPDTTATRLTFDGTRCTGAEVTTAAGTGSAGTAAITAGPGIV